MNQSFARELQKYISNQVTNLRHWIRPDPEDPLYLKIIKGFFKGIVILLLTALSPVIAIILTIAFLAAL
ncbi:MAG: hypothetical protein ACLFUB_20980 [Cyclobacteriaceae bacterium]